MGSNNLNRAMAGVISLFLIWSCNDKSNEVKKGELSPFALKYMSMQMGSQDAAKTSQAGAINMSFQNQYSSAHSVTGGTVGADSATTSEPGDTSLYGNPWVSCAVITQTINEDSSITTTTDYGSGCDEGWDNWKYRIWGKIVSTYLYTNRVAGSTLINDYYYDTQYDNYGGYYYSDSSQWGMNGFSSYSGESVYDTVLLTFSGSYTYQDDNTYRWNDTTYSYKSKGKTTYTNNSWITENADYEYSNGSNYYYKSTVLKPLVMDYTCTPPIMYLNGRKTGGDTATDIYVMTYVSGIEEVTYLQGSESGHFTIDYGNGECDNLVTITENGTVSVIDLGKFRTKETGGVVVMTTN